MSLKVSKITGGYTNKPVLHDISFEVDDYEVVGLIGLNGAGKSTTIKHIMGLMEPFSGQIEVDGLTIQKDPTQYRKKLSFIPETPLIYQSLTLKEHLEILGLAYDISFSEIMKRANPLLEKFRLTEKLDWFPQDFSKGMKQKAMIISALVTDPDVLIIDEPFVGLDPLAIMDFEQIVQNEKEKGKSILMSTHVLANAEKICDSFVILNNGEVFAKGTLEELVEQFNLPENNLESIYRLMVQEEGVYYDA